METKYAFRSELKDEIRVPWIRKTLEIHDAMNIKELCRVSGCSREEVHSALAMMVQRGEVEILRPANCRNDDMDFFRLPGPVRSPGILTDNSCWFAGFKRAAQLLFDDKEEKAERCLNKILTIS